MPVTGRVERRGNQYRAILQLCEDVTFSTAWHNDKATAFLSALETAVEMEWSIEWESQNVEETRQ